MKCKKCAGDLPYGAYGKVKCEYCNTINNVPTPEQEREKKVEVEEATGRKWASLAITIVLLGIIGSVAAFVPLVDVPERYQDTVTEMVREKYTVYETKIEAVPRQKTYTEQVPKKVMKTVQKEVPTTKQVTTMVQEAYQVQEDIEYRVTDFEYHGVIGFWVDDHMEVNLDYELLENAGGDVTVRFVLLKAGSLADSKTVTLSASKATKGPHYFHEGWLDDGVFADPCCPESMYTVEYYFTVPKKTVTKYRDVEKVDTVPDTKIVTEQVEDIVYETVRKTRTVYDKVEKTVPVTKERLVPKQKTITKTRTVRKTLLEYFLAQPLW